MVISLVPTAQRFTIYAFLGGVLGTGLSFIGFSENHCHNDHNNDIFIVMENPLFSLFSPSSYGNIHTLLSSVTPSLLKAYSVPLLRIGKAR